MDEILIQKPKKTNGGTTAYDPRVVNNKLIRVAVECEGISPLLQNKMTEAVLHGLRTKEKPPKSATPQADITPREEASSKVHLAADGWPIIPPKMSAGCLVSAGRYIRLDGKRQLSTATSTMLWGCMSFDDPALRLFVPGSPETQAVWEPDIAPGTNHNSSSSTAVALVRPRFDAWAFRATIEIDTGEVGEHLIRQLWDKAGKNVGMGSFRPEKKGTFGRFAVRCWERLT